MSYVDSESHFVADVTELFRRGELAVFAGAGISAQAGGPLVCELLPKMLSGFDLNEAQIDRLYRHLPFEAVLEQIQHEVDILRLLPIFDLEKPTPLHILIARLASRGLLRTIATTNFDRLFEFALEGQGLRNGPDYAIHHRDVSAIDVGCNIPQVIKLHGCVNDPPSVAITLRQVAAKSLSAQRGVAIDCIFSQGPHTAVFVLGYSCSDVFDISPHITGGSSQNKKQIYFVEHRSSADGDALYSENVSLKEARNPFKTYSGIRLFADTSHVIQLLWTALFEDTMPSMSPESAKWPIAFADWLAVSRPTVEPKSSLIAGGLLRRVGDLNAAEYRLRTSLQMANRIGDLRTAARAAANAGACCLGLGEYDNAEALFNAGMNLTTRTGDSQAYIEIRAQLAGVYHGRGQYEKALELLQLSFNDLDTRGDRSAAGTCAGNIAAALFDQGKFEDSLKFADLYLKLSRVAGDKVGESWALDRLGLIHRDVGNLQEAMWCRVKGLEISRLIGDRVLESRHLGEIGVCLHLKGKYHEAIDSNLEALRIAREIGDKQAEGNRLANLGRHYRASGRHPLALEALRMAITIASEIGDQQGESNACGSLGLLFEDMGYLEEATHYLQAALRITRRIGNKIGSASHLRNLAGLSARRNRFEDAKALLTEELHLEDDLFGPDHLRTRETAAFLRKLLRG